MSELQDLFWTEKYRPTKFDDLILTRKEELKKFFQLSGSVPSFIFTSTKPGTGKTSCAKVAINEYNLEALLINSSDERGIDIIREEVKIFARLQSTFSNQKRCIFMDEADGMTRQAQDSLRNIMETYSANCFFIFSCNDLSKIIEPLRSRCVIINFEKPSKSEIIDRLQTICDKEQLKLDPEDLDKIADSYYPDIRSMIKRLQVFKVSGKALDADEKEFDNILALIKEKRIHSLYLKVYSGTFDILLFNRWFFQKTLNMESISLLGLDRLSKITLLLANTEKSWNLGSNIEVVFMANTLQIMKLL